MFDFSADIKSNKGSLPLICAHRGSSGGNIACNTLAAFNAALMQGADMVELDVAKSRDSQLFVFHPGMEKPHLGKAKLLLTMSASSIEKRRFVNQDNTKTELGINRLEDILDFLKGKCYINVDKFWTDIPAITACIRKCGVEKQVIVKTPTKESYYRQLKEIAPDFMYLPVIKDKDEITDRLVDMGINCIGAEICFDSENAPVCSDEYVESMHKKGRLIFSNAIVYDYRTQLAAGHSDDRSLIDSPDNGWGWLIDKGFDIIQTDFAGMLRTYMDKR